MLFSAPTVRRAVAGGLGGSALAGAMFQISSGAEGPLTRTSDDRDPDIVVPLNLVEMM